MPPKRGAPRGSIGYSGAGIVPSAGIAPSATTTIEKECPVRWRRRSTEATSSRSNGRSGSRIVSAPPAIPDDSAIHPALRPITSTTISRSWLSAVVWSRSIASVATCTAVANPMHASVPDRSLSIVFGMPTTGTPSDDMCAAAPIVPSPPIATRASTPEVRERAADALDALLVVRVGAGGPQDRPAAMQDPLDGRRRELEDVPVHHPAPAPAEPEDLEPVHADRRAHDRADRRVQAGRVPAGREDADACGHSSRSCRVVLRSSPVVGLSRTWIVRPGRSGPARSTGFLERLIDLSQAAAEYLGVGVSWVHAEILVPTSRI